ncbi:MAG: hypothetical protein PHQ27_01555 [Victivallales bacterium]|nr:hypothetical protein [Victivallales bacterium]
MERNLKRIELKTSPEQRVIAGIVAALVLTAVMMALFSATSNGLLHLAAVFTAESRAVLVMQVTVNRLQALPSYNRDTAARVFREEVAAAGFDAAVRAETTTNPAGDLQLTLIYNAAALPMRRLATVDLPCQPN